MPTYSGATRLSSSEQTQVKSLAKAFKQLFNLAATDYTQSSGFNFNDDQLGYIAMQTAVAFTGKPYTSGFNQDVKWTQVYQFAYTWLST